MPWSRPTPPKMAPPLPQPLTHPPPSPPPRPRPKRTRPRRRLSTPNPPRKTRLARPKLGALMVRLGPFCPAGSVFFFFRCTRNLRPLRTVVNLLSCPSALGWHRQGLTPSTTHTLPSILLAPLLVRWIDGVRSHSTWGSFYRDVTVNVPPTPPPFRFFKLLGGVNKKVLALKKYPVFLVKFLLMQLIRIAAALSFVVAAYIIADDFDVENISNDQSVPDQSRALLSRAALAHGGHRIRLLHRVAIAFRCVHCTLCLVNQLYSSPVVDDPTSLSSVIKAQSTPVAWPPRTHVRTHAHIAHKYTDTRAHQPPPPRSRSLFTPSPSGTRRLQCLVCST
jgi:hypothetical protein